MFNEDSVELVNTSLPGVILVKQETYSDRRGHIWSLNTNRTQEIHRQLGYDFFHVKFNTNKKNVLRGIHFDNRTAKLVSCVSGQISQFIIDVDEKSENFGRYERVDLQAGDGLSLIIPAGYGNAFYAKKDGSTYCYILSYDGKYADANAQRTIQHDDPRFNINWGLKNFILSERDGGN